MPNDFSPANVSFFSHEDRKETILFRFVRNVKDGFRQLHDHKWKWLSIVVSDKLQLISTVSGVCRLQMAASQTPVSVIYVVAQPSLT